MQVGEADQACEQAQRMWAAALLDLAALDLFGEALGLLGEHPASRSHRALGELQLAVFRRVMQTAAVSPDCFAATPR